VLEREDAQLTDPTVRVDKGEMSIPTAFAWSKFHIRLGVMFYLNPKLLLGLGFRGGLALDPDPDVMPFAPTVLANLGFRIVGDTDSTFQLEGLVGLGGGVIQHRIPYTDCVKRPLSSGDPWYEDVYDEYGNPIEQYGCAQGINEDARDGWAAPVAAPGQQQAALHPDSLAWDTLSDQTDKVFFRKAGYFTIEAGLDAYIWFVKAFGLNIGIMADAYIPEFALNFDFQLGFALRF
jgi:hypothetical protein